MMVMVVTYLSGMQMDSKYREHTEPLPNVGDQVMFMATMPQMNTVVKKTFEYDKSGDLNRIVIDLELA